MIASAALNVHTPPNTRQVPTFIRSCLAWFLLARLRRYSSQN
ncbi:hypothetical protein D050_1329 [Vibrio parahaemolyticus VPCR-2009]|nr:hypothetical protein D050_1329 [Vibrio parahaemolyticus VPCR-2009]